MDISSMNPCQATTLVTALANVLAQKLTDEELEIFATMTTQLGDTSETIIVQRSIYCKNNCLENSTNSF